MRLATTLDKKIGEDVSHFDFHCPLPFKIVFHCFWNFPACIIRSWFLCKNSDAKEKSIEKITAIRNTIRETLDRIKIEGFRRGLQNTRRYVYESK